MERSEKNKINHLSIVFSGMSSVSLGWGERSAGGGLKPPLHLRFEILWFPSPGKWQKVMVGTAGRGHGDGKPRVTRGLVLVGPRGAARAFHGTVPGNGAHRAFVWAA